MAGRGAAAAGEASRARRVQHRSPGCDGASSAARAGKASVCGRAAVRRTQGALSSGGSRGRQSSVSQPWKQTGRSRAAQNEPGALTHRLQPHRQQNPQHHVDQHTSCRALGPSTATDPHTHGSSPGNPPDPGREQFCRRSCLFLPRMAGFEASVGHRCCTLFWALIPPSHTFHSLPPTCSRPPQTWSTATIILQMLQMPRETRPIPSNCFQ